MLYVPYLLGTRGVRFAFAGMTAALLAGCADSSHFVGDPLGNPFRTASSEPRPAASVDGDMAPPPPYRPSHSAVQSHPLAPPSSESHRVASYEPPRAERTASIAATSGHGGWSSEGGMAIVAANGDSAAVLAERYNVPTEALLHANGFSSAAQVRPGTRLVIPVYSANGGASRMAASEPASKPHDHASRERLLAQHEMKQAGAVREARIERREDMKPARREDTKVARRDEPAHDMRWVKGPQPAVRDHGKLTAEAEHVHGREKAMAQLEQKKADKAAEMAELKTKKAAKTEAAQQLAEAKAARKAANMQAAEARLPKQGKAEVASAAPAVVREAPVKVAKAEEPVLQKTDPTPTASLPPAAEEKVSANGNPEFRWPAHGRIIQGFKSGGNDGINIAVPEGTAVKAAESGVVAYAGSEIKGFGNLVLIRHPNGYVTAYANNANITVHRGEQVKRGQTVATSGQSGNVASPQLHFEVRKGSTPVDPTRYLAGL